MIVECGNCYKQVTLVFKDKVSNKLVCQDCIQQAIDLGIRFSFDFELL